MTVDFPPPVGPTIAADCPGSITNETFFRTGVPPVPEEETIEIFAFMRAANMSKAAGGKVVTIEQAMKSGNKEAKKLLKKYN